MIAAKSKLSVWAPKTPGAEPSLIRLCDTMDEARETAARFKNRADLRMQDVVIRLEANDRIIERCGPCR